MTVGPGAIIRKRWSPLRREIERILADGAWHEDVVLFRQVERFVDPRIAARHWARMYTHVTRMRDIERPPASEMLRRCEAQALRSGARSAYWDVIRTMLHKGRLEAQVWQGRRRLRLAP